MKQGIRAEKVHFASLIDLCHLKNSELEPKIQKYKGRIVLRGDIVKDDSGWYAVFTAQGSSASQMTAANVMDIIIKTTRMRRTSSRRSIHLHSGQSVRCTNVLKKSKVRMSRCLDTSTETQMAKIILHCHPLAGLLWERQFEKVFLKHGWEKVRNWECLFVKRERGLFLSVYVDDFKQAGKKQNTCPTWTMLMKDVDLGEPTSFLDHVYLGCTQTACKMSNDIVTNYRDMFESRIAAGAKEKLPTKAPAKPETNTIFSWSYDMESHVKKCVEKYCELANKPTQQFI